LREGRVLKRNRSTRRTSSLWHRFVHSACARRALSPRGLRLVPSARTMVRVRGTRRPRLTSLPIQIVGRDARNTRARGATFGSLKRAKYGDRACGNPSVSRERPSSVRPIGSAGCGVSRRRALCRYSGRDTRGRPIEARPHTVRVKIPDGGNSVRIRTPTSSTLPSSPALCWLASAIRWTYRT